MQDTNLEEGRMSKIIESKCQCGEPVLIEIGSKFTCRVDKKRPNYPESPLNCTVFRCKKCGGFLGDTCKDAAFD